MNKGKITDMILKSEAVIRNSDNMSLREIVLSIIPIYDNLRDFGKSLIPRTEANSARDRILYYFKKYPEIIINGKELLVISGIQDYPRRIRELRCEFGWHISSGITMRDEKDDEDGRNIEMKPDDYVLLSLDQDRDAAHRWNIANDIRKAKSSVKDRVLEYFKENVGKMIQNEELKYVARNASEWARRVRELRTEDGWKIVTKTTGRPDFPIGFYMLIDSFQLPKHDRSISDKVRSDVLRRDEYSCQECGWKQSDWHHADPRHIDLHHMTQHKDKGENTVDNLITLCNKCHKKKH
jgi:hypothetical protein